MIRFTKHVSRRCALPRVLRRLCGNERAEGYAVAAANGYTNGQRGVAVAIYHPPVSPSAFAGTVDTYQAVISTSQQR
jgi:hypothetical protein